MSHSVEINKLVEFIENNNEFNIIKSNSCFYNHHFGAVLADIILQAGLNYKSVVLPRVLDIYKNYSSANNLTGIIETIDDIGIEKFLNWKNETKIIRFKSVLEYLLENNINSSIELVEHLGEYRNVERLLSINGIGNKTVDYFLKLMHVETIAVDRHIINFLNQANIDFKDYYNAKKIVEYTADILSISRRDIDYSIWYFMSEKSKQKILEFDF